MKANFNNILEQYNFTQTERKTSTQALHLNTSVTQHHQQLNKRPRVAQSKTVL